MNCPSSHHALPLVLLQPAYLQHLAGSCLHKSSLRALVLPLSKVNTCTVSSLTGPLQHLTIATDYTLLSTHCLVHCTADEPLWTTTDPFDICSDATESAQAAQPQVDAKSQMEERRRKRQEAYRHRRELRKQQQQGVLLDDIDHQDVFGHQSK